MLVWGAVGPAIICPARGGWGVGPGMGLGRERVGWNHWSGVLLEDPPASGSAAVRPPIWGVESCARRRTPLGQDQASKDLSHIPRGCTQAKGIAWAQHRGPVSDDTRRAVPKKNWEWVEPLCKRLPYSPWAATGSPWGRAPGPCTLCAKGAQSTGGLLYQATLRGAALRHAPLEFARC